MTDGHGRKIEYLRVSITDRCDLNCVYCRPESTVNSGELPDAASIISICRAAAELGIKRVRLTGGEPLTRADCPELVSSIKAVNGIETVCLTTNGTRLEQYAQALSDAAADGINISLDTSDRAQYMRITGKDRLDAVNKGIDKAYSLGLHLKLNCVVTELTTEKTIRELLRYPAGRHIDLRFIELMPIGRGRDNKFISNSDIFRLIDSICHLERRSPKGLGPAVYYSSPQLKGSIGFISAMSHSFCDKCDRLRITADGIIKPCLCYGSDISIKGIEHDTEMIKTALLRAAAEKPAAHCFNSKTGITENKAMDMIGG